MTFSERVSGPLSNALLHLNVYCFLYRHTLKSYFYRTHLDNQRVPKWGRAETLLERAIYCGPGLNFDLNFLDSFDNQRKSDFLEKN